MQGPVLFGPMLNAASEKRLQGIHPDLAKVVHRASEVCTIHFEVTEGLRTIERQKQLLALGATKTLKSRHITGHAVDLVAMIDFDGDGKLDVRWDWPLYKTLATSMKTAAVELQIPIVWGGDWPKFRDGPHFELSKQFYPEKK